MTLAKVLLLVTLGAAPESTPEPPAIEFAGEDAPAPEPPPIEFAEEDAPPPETEDEDSAPLDDTDAPEDDDPVPTPEEDSSEPVYPEFVEQPTTPPDDGKKRRSRSKKPPPVYGPLLVTGGFGAGPNSVGVGLGLTRFVVPWVGIGGSIGDTLFFDSGVFNEFTLIPHVWLIALPYRRFTPYVRGGFGLQAFSHRLGVYAQWRSGGGIILRLGKYQRLALRLGLDVTGSIPDARFARNFTCGLVDSPCSLSLRPEIGVGFRFGQN